MKRRSRQWRAVVDGKERVIVVKLAKAIEAFETHYARKGALAKALALVGEWGLAEKVRE